MSPRWPIFALPPAGVTRPAESGAIPLATVVPGNILSEDEIVMPRGAPGGRIILWSGWMGDDDSRPAEGCFPPDFRTWSAPGRKAFNAYCDRTGPSLDSRGLTVLFRPHARHVLSDAQACFSFLTARAAEPFNLILDPSGLLTSAMIPKAHDHLVRAYEALAPSGRVAALALTNLEPVPGPPDPLSGAELRACPLARGLLQTDLLISLAESHWPAGRPILLIDPAADSGLLPPTLS